MILVIKNDMTNVIIVLVMVMHVYYLIMFDSQLYNENAQIYCNPTKIDKSPTFNL